MTLLLETRNVSKSYGTFRALDQVNMSVHQGELVAVVGPNGAGKTTWSICSPACTRRAPGRSCSWERVSPGWGRSSQVRAYHQRPGCENDRARCAAAAARPRRRSDRMSGVMSPIGTLLPGANGAARPQPAKADFASLHADWRGRCWTATSQACAGGLSRAADRCATPSSMA